MPNRNKELAREYKARWYQTTVLNRRKEWLDSHGPCASCGSRDNLEVDHIKRETKISHSVWTWSKQRREVELAKCQVLCYDCHIKKTVKENWELGIFGKNKIVPPTGMGWCYANHHFVSRDRFTKNRTKWDGLEWECKDCRSNRRSKKRVIARVG